MPIFELPIEIVADLAPIDTLTPLYLQRQKHLDKYVFRQSVDEECQIAYVGYPSLIFNNSVAVNKQVNSIPENRRREGEDSWTKISGGALFSSSTDLLITSVAVIEGGVEKPLFFGMELPRNTVSATASSFNKSDREFLFQYDSDSQVIYTNKTNYWDPALNDFRAITVRYRLDTGEEFSVLFRNAPVYRLARVSDIDPDTLTLYEGAPVFTRTGVPGGYDYVINGTGPFYVKEVKEEAINVTRSGGQKLNEPWLLDISAGSFNRTYDGRVYTYSPTEFERQAFFPYYPFARYSHRPGLIDPRTLKLPESGLQVDPDNRLHVDVIVRNEDGELKAAYSTSSLKIGELYAPWSWDVRTVYWQELEYGYDQTNAILLLNNALPILSSDQVVVNYSAIKTKFTYRELNLNPNYNKRLAQYDYLVYMVPNRAEEDNKTIFHIEYDYLPDGSTRITRLSQPSVPSFLGSTIESFMTARFVNNTNVYQYVPLAYTSLRPEFSVGDILSRDARLKKGIDRKNQLEVLRKHPWSWFTKVFDTNQIEYPDKFFMRVSVDQEEILERDDRDSILERLNVHAAAGSTIVLSNGGIQPRVKDIQCKVDEVLEMQFMPERPGTTHYLYQLRDGATLPNLDLDTQLTSFTIGYGTSLSTQTHNVAALAGDFHKFYMACELPSGGFTKASTVFEVRIRNV